MSKKLFYRVYVSENFKKLGKSFCTCFFFFVYKENCWGLCLVINCLKHVIMLMHQYAYASHSWIPVSDVCKVQIENQRVCGFDII